MIRRRRSIESLAVATGFVGLLVTAGCSSSPPSDNAAASTSAANCPPAPTTESLEAMATKAMNPDTSAIDLLQMVQGMSTVDPTPIETALRRARQYAPRFNLSQQITKVDNNCVTATAQATVTVNNQHPMQLSVPFVYDNGAWKIEKGYFCGLLGQATEQAPPEMQSEVQQAEQQVKQSANC